jgi:hypothetical protein
MKYVKKTPRIDVKFIDSATEEVLFEIKDRSWMNIGEIFSDGIVTSIIENEYKNKKFIPKNILIMAVGEYRLEQ